MRDKLIELIRKAKTKVVFYATDGTPIREYKRLIVERSEAKDLADYLLENGVIVLPCKEGDTVYYIENNTEACFNCEYYSPFYGMDELCDKNKDFETYPTVADNPLCDKQFYEIKELKPTLNWISNHRNEFGKTVFLTREEAEQALKEKEKGE